APTGQRLEGHEQVGGPVALVLTVLLGRAPDPNRQRWAHLADQLLAALVHAHRWALGIVWSVIHLDHVFHHRDERPTLARRDDPLLLKPRLEFIFFNARQTVDGLIDSTTFNSTRRSASNSIVQRAWPSGAFEQVTATSWASCAPSSLRYCRPVG